jgi:predicted nucleotidyltransferase
MAFDFLDLFSSKLGIQLLKIFLDSPDNEFYQNEVIKESRLAPNTAIKWLKTLASYRLLNESWKGGLKIYALNKDSPVVRQMKILLNVAAVNDAVKSFAGQDFELYLFGSAARGEDDRLSDIDVLIIGKVDDQTVVQVEESIKNALDREVNPVVKDPLEYSQLARTDRVFYENLQRDRIRIL